VGDGRARPAVSLRRCPQGRVVGIDPVSRRPSAAERLFGGGVADRIRGLSCRAPVGQRSGLSKNVDTLSTRSLGLGSVSDLSAARRLATESAHELWRVARPCLVPLSGLTGERGLTGDARSQLDGLRAHVPSAPFR